MMELVDLSWRAYPAGLLIVLGIGGAVWSAARGVARARRVRDPLRALAIMQGFRIAIVSLAVAAIGAAWWWQIGWLFVLALVIGGEELLESTVVITALKHSPTLEGAAPSAPRQGGVSPIVAHAAPTARRPPHAHPTAASQRAVVLSRSGGSGRA